MKNRCYSSADEDEFIKPFGRAKGLNNSTKQNKDTSNYNTLSYSYFLNHNYILH